jgi:hypothetical protein
VRRRYNGRAFIAEGTQTQITAFVLVHRIFVQLAREGLPRRQKRGPWRAPRPPGRREPSAGCSQRYTAECTRIATLRANSWSGWRRGGAGKRPWLRHARRRAPGATGLTATGTEHARRARVGVLPWVLVSPASLRARVPSRGSQIGDLGKTSRGLKSAT